VASLAGMFTCFSLCLFVSFTGSMMKGEDGEAGGSVCVSWGGFCCHFGRLRHSFLEEVVAGVWRGSSQLWRCGGIFAVTMHGFTAHVGWLCSLLWNVCLFCNGKMQSSCSCMV
jgi:hypothetical protein